MTDGGCRPIFSGKIAQHFRGKPTLKELRSTLLPIFRDFRGQSLLKFPGIKIHFIVNVYQLKISLLQTSFHN